MSNRVGSLRRSSYSSSSTSLRRSSVSSRDIHAIQAALLRQRPVSNHTVIVLIGLLPWLSYFLLYSIHTCQGAFWETVSSLLFRWPFGLRLLPPFFDVISWKILLVFISVQLLLHEVLPRDPVTILSGGGAESSSKETNGLACIIVLCLAYVLGATLKLYRHDLVYQHFEGIIGCLSVVAIVGTFLLYANYRFGEAHNVENVYDFFFGVEQEPKLLEIEIKHFIRSRITMGLYALFIISSLYYSNNNSKVMHPTVLLTGVSHLFYILCWQWCEDIHLNGIDEKVANLGFARIWLDLVLYPVIYTSPATIVVMEKKHIAVFLAAFLCVSAVVSTVFMYLAARQRLHFRQHRGNVKVSGHDPYFIMAKYRSDGGDTTANLLLGSGYWGSSRHPSYAFDIGVHAALSMMGGWSGVFGHAPFIVILLYYLIRISFDEQRCLAKYGSAWSQHCARVSYKLIPGLY
ncbi:hypothetical protein PENTCL1PPCAC_1815 [Pristionchus entomophagus]|uniref:7-dehydrocholesterol reductase n=1 Tax=Pristionchus entomophagus TaxID=358040 RepID=A0AAV5SA73_9BILA|nr:hypothetical protein PENTCL1PPCAC_1815 [Pristionchus entomophagus]